VGNASQASRGLEICGVCGVGPGRESEFVGRLGDYWVGRWGEIERDIGGRSVCLGAWNLACFESFVFYCVGLSGWISCDAC
jgi:hypothetical protein